MFRPIRQATLVGSIVPFWIFPRRQEWSLSLRLTSKTLRNNRFSVVPCRVYRKVRLEVWICVSYRRSSCKNQRPLLEEMYLFWKRYFPIEKCPFWSYLQSTYSPAFQTFSFEMKGCLPRFVLPWQSVRRRINRMPKKPIQWRQAQACTKTACVA